MKGNTIARNYIYVCQIIRYNIKKQVNENSQDLHLFNASYPQYSLLTDPDGR